METTDGVVHIHHEADWSSTALVSWVDPATRPHEAAIPAALLWGDPNGGDGLCRPPHSLPVSVAVRAARMAARGRARWEHDEVLSRPVPGRVLLPWSARDAERRRHDPTDSWLFDADLATESCGRPGEPRRRIPLGWVENVAIAMRNNELYDAPSSLLIDIGAPHRDPCTCGKPFHDRGCPQDNTFPRIGRLAIYLERVDKFIETMQAARTSTERIFVL